MTPLLQKELRKSHSLELSHKIDEILKNRIVLNKHHLKIFKDLEIQNDGVWVEDISSTLMSQGKDRDIREALRVYGLRSVHEVMLRLPDFQVFAPGGKQIPSDYLLCKSSNPYNLFYDDKALKRFLKSSQGRDIVVHLNKVHEKYLGQWVPMDAIADYTPDNLPLTLDGKLQVLLLYQYDLLNVACFLGVYFIQFRNKHDKYKERNIVDCKYTLDHLHKTHNVEIENINFHNHRQDILDLIHDVSNTLTIIKVTSPTEMAVMLTKNVAACQSLQKRMKQFYDLKQPIFFMKPEHIDTLIWCVVRTEDGEYRRAMIARVYEQNVLVDLTDCGWMIEVNKSELMYLHSMFTRPPTQAFTLKIAHVNKLLVDSQTIIDWLNEKVAPNNISIEVCHLSPEKRIVSGLLYVKTPKRNVYINNVLVEKGYVEIRTEPCERHGIF